MVTGEKFIKDNLGNSINEKFKPLSVDMETTSIAHVCYVNKVPFIAIRSITDTLTHIGMQNFEKNCKKVSVIAKDVTISFIDKLRRYLWKDSSLKV